MIIDDITDRMYVRFNLSQRMLELATYVNRDDCTYELDLLKKVISESDKKEFDDGLFKFERFGIDYNNKDELFPNGWVYGYQRKNYDMVYIMPIDVYDVYCTRVTNGSLTSYPNVWDYMMYAILHRYESQIKCRYIDGRIKIIKRPPPDRDFPCIVRYDDGTEIKWVR